MKKLKILIIEDDLMVIKSLKRIIGNSVVIFVATSCGDAKIILEVEKIDIVICDYDLGNENTIGIVKKYAGNETFFYANSSDDDSNIELVKAGCSDVIGKKNLLKLKQILETNGAAFDY